MTKNHQKKLPEKKYSAAIFRKVKAKMIQYAFENGYSWDQMYYTLCSFGNLSIDNNNLINIKDPRHMCVNDHMPKNEKMEFYISFIKSVYLDVDLSDESDQIHEIGISIAKMSCGISGLNRRDFISAAKNLDEKIFVSDFCPANDYTSPCQSVNLIMYQTNTKSPLVRIVYTTIRIDGQNREITDALTLINDEIMSGVSHPRHKITTLHVGILCPIKIEGAAVHYHGLCTSPNYMPVHLFMQHRENGNIMINQLTDPLSPSEIKIFQMVESSYPNIRHFLTTLPDNLS